MGINSKTSEDKFLNHARSQEWLQEDIARKRNEEVKREFGNRPVCPRCERIAFRDTGYRSSGGSACPHCGWTGSTQTLNEIIKDKSYR